ncbi:MAG: prepilin-type N-terminal cleavage/methylation domain-containing protein [Lachnospiraceae bacterium]|nr:prepilin-type N-terminal cleavage/methylation domain-containing protein [Lachnospiraceae bacterium]
MKKLFDKLGKKGFTLVELTVVLVIIGILAAIGIPTAMHFIKKAEYRKNEENAKTAYLAVESTLTWYRSSGEWEAFRNEVMANGVENNTFPAGDEREGRIYAISVNHWDGVPSQSQEQAMKLLDGGVYSKDFFNAEIVIEIDVESGQVYSAFYGTRCDSLTYKETTADGERCISAAGNWREPDTRKEVVLGYYSVEDVTNVVELKQVRLKVTTINLINSETLSLNWTSNSRNDNLDVKYLITFYQKDDNGDKKLFTTEVELSELRGQLKTVPSEDAGISTKTGMVNLEVKDPNEKDVSWGEWAFPLTYQQTGGSSGRFSLVLDGMMTAELAEVVEANKGMGDSVSDVAQKASTSITRLGAVVPALKSPQDIYAEILAQPAYREITGEDGTSITMNITEYKPSSPVRSNTENTLFAKAGMKIQTGEDGAEITRLEAEITRFRHLSNIRYYEPEEAAVFTLASRNMDWTSTGVGMYGVSRNETEEGGVASGYGKVKWSNAANEDKILDFPSIPLLKENHKLEGKKGIQAQLSNLHLGTGSMPDDEQIGKLYSGIGGDKVTHYLGLICESEGQIEELTLSDPVLRLVGGDGAGTGNAGGEDSEAGADSTGAAAGTPAGGIPAAAENFDALYGVGILCGRNQGSLKNINIKTTEREHQTVLVRLKDREEEISGTLGQAKKPAGIGGLVGVLAGKNDDGSLAKLTDAAMITLSGLTTEGKVTGYLPSPEGGLGAANPGTGTGSANPGGTAGAGAASAEERAKDYTYGIGGIFGYAWIGKDAGGGNYVQLVKCTNHGDVDGNLFTGGIVGALKGDFATETESLVSIRDSINNGLVLCMVNYKEEDNRLEGRYFGGILGYGDGVRIINCVNASQYREDFNDTKKDELLHGHYVGGIIGYGNNSQLSGCSTRKGSYVLGSDYVGGIAGGLSNVLQEAITGENSESAGVQITTNGGYIIGNRYVGGIVGKNDGPELTTVANCINNGVAAGYDRYIGGIVGYNGTNGVIKDCASYFSDYGGFIFQMIVDKWKAAGDCAGGLAGYNNGKVVFNSDSQGIQVRSVSSIVVGDNYVGGVIGFNDMDGTLDVAYTLIGGQIHGYGNAVGGCIGLNASEKILETELSISPTSIEGNYYVGGCIGANVVNLTEDKAMTKVKADNRLGSITGNAFTGGVIGYQRTYTEEQLKEELINVNPGWLGQAGGSDSGGNGLSSHDILGKNGKILLLSYIEGIEDAASEGDAASEAVLAGTAGKLLPLLREDHVPAEVLTSKNEMTLTIGDRANKEEGMQTEYNNIPVYSDLYTGGIVGYCERNSRMHIVNTRNSGNLSRRSQAQAQGDGVSLKAYLESRELDADIKELEGEDLNLEISIGGGIIGANLENQIIDHCINTGIMNGFIGLGGIVGFNAGGVFNCQLSDNFGNPGLNYIGGIAGLNVHAGGANESPDGSSRKNGTYQDVLGISWKDFTSGTVALCSTQEGRNISGRSYVGGIVGYNLSGAGMISNRNNANVTGAGDYVGGMAGANSGSILVAENGNANPAYAIAGNNGQGIGGIVGWNRASGIIDVTSDKEDVTEIVAVDNNVSITGREKVGGIVGINEGKLDASATDQSVQERFLVCRAKSVHATGGYAGGIIGEARRKAGTAEGTAGEAKIARAINKSVNVTADRGPAGGIVAVNQQGFQLESCINLGNVNSDNGYAGGIAAENYGQIMQCKVGDETREEVGITISSRGADAIGAVCAVNHGVIWESAPEKSMAEKDGKNTVILSGTSKLVGGIAGQNAAGGQIGMAYIEGGTDENTTLYHVSYMPHIDIAAAALTVGGVAGQNQPALFEADAAGNGEQAAELKPTTVIQNVSASGLAFEGFNNYQYLGGIAGENQNGAVVKDCIFADGKIIQNSGTAAGNCYGGVAGRNDGNLQNCRIEGITINVQGIYTATSTSTAQEKENLASHIGGIAGKNEENGVIEGCLIAMGQGADGKLKANNINVANGMAGGVAGYNKNKIWLSGDEITADLMDVQTGADGSVSAGVMDVQTLIRNAEKNDVTADASYVNWKANGDLENQTYNGGSDKVSDGRNLLLIMSNNGNLGGITAYNAPAGEVGYCATGNWYLNNKSEAIGVGTGGIIGMNESEKNLVFLLNQAFVGRQLRSGVTDRFAGGIIGNQNNTTIGGWTIQNSVNYGTVYCKNAHYSGGILGQWTGTGGNIEKCYNFGNLQTTHGEGWLGASGGIVAQLYHAYENNEYNIVSCGNYGNIYGQQGRGVTNQSYKDNAPNCANDSAGILGNVTAYRVENADNAQRFTINVIDCVNGPGVEIYSGSMASGIVGFFSCNNPNTDPITLSTSHITLNIERCRNYASKLLGLQFVAGIFGDRYGEAGAKKTTLKYCFSLDYDQYENYVPGDNGARDQQPYPIVSCKNDPPAKPGAINQGDGEKVYNFFLGNRDGIDSFPTGSFSHNVAYRDRLQKVNSNWVYSFVRDDARYFVYISERNYNANYTIANWKIAGKQFGDIIQNGYNQEIGYVLFTIEGDDKDKYSNMTSIVNKGSEFDQYVRKFCFTQAGLLLAPEKVVLSKTDDGQFMLEVDAPAYADSDNIEYVATLHRKADDGTESKIPADKIENPAGSGITVNADGTFQFDSETCTFALSSDVIEEGGELFVKLKAREKDDLGTESTEVKSNSVPLGSVLPEPKLRIELVSNGAGSYQYRFRLANQKAYEGYSDLKVHVKLMDGTELNFDTVNPDGTAGTATYGLAANSLQQLVVWVAKDGVAPGSGTSSAEVSVPVYLPSYTPSIAVKGGSVTQPSCTVSGTSLKDLAITVTLTGPGGNITTPPIYRAELVGTWTDKDGNRKENYVFQTADILTTANGTVDAVFTDFADSEDLPEEFASAEDLKVRVWYAQSGLGPVYTYYMDLNGETPNTRTKETIDGEEENGPQWQDAYTHVLTDPTFNDYRWESGKLFDWLDAPVLMTVPDGKSLTPEIDSSNGHLMYTFKWDEGKNPEQNDYIVTLTGITIDEAGNKGNPVSIVTDREVKGGELTLDAEDWPYQEVELSVTRKGYTDSAANTIYIGKTTVGTYQVKKRLPRPEQPKVTNPDVNELGYQIEWNPVTPEIGPDGTPPVSGCTSYEIYIRPVTPSVPADPNDEKRYSVDVWGTVDGTTTPNITSEGVYRELIDFEKYAGKQILISIKAMAAADDEVYVHSVDGVTYELTVPERIETPNIKEWEKNWKHERYEPGPDNPDNIDQTKSIEEFEEGGENGLKVALTAADADSIPPGGSSYLTKAYIFETEDDAKAAQQALIDNDETALEAALEMLVAYYPLLNAENQLIPAGMEPEGDSQVKFSHTLTGLSAEYAGKYILFSARISSGGGKVSSQWVVQKDTNPDPFIWQLPYVKLPTPEVSVGTGEQEVEMTFTINPDIRTTSSVPADEPEEAVNGEENSSVGNVGNIGNSDEAVNDGNTGNSENGGTVGSAGDTGNAGTAGSAGDTGNAGTAGSAGSVGDTGNTENAGNTGNTGAAGTEANPDGNNAGASDTGGNNADTTGNTENTGTDTGNSETADPMPSETANRRTAVRKVSAVNENASGRRNGRMAAERMINILTSNEMIYRMGGMAGNDITFMTTAVNTSAAPATSSIQPADNTAQPDGTSQSQPGGSGNASAQPDSTGQSQPGGSGNASAQPDSTGQSQPGGSGNASAQPDGTGQSQPGGSTNAQPDGTNQSQPGGSGNANAQPGNTGQGQPGGSGNASAQPGNTGQGQPGTGTNIQPDSTGQGQPDESTNAQPDNVSQDQPGASTNQQPGSVNGPADGANAQPDGTSQPADGIALQADAIQGQEIWTAENTVLTWSSVQYADAYYFTLTDKGGMDDGRDRIAEFKIVETKGEDDPSVIPAATVYGKDGNGDWQQVGTTGTDLAAGTDYTFDLSQTMAVFQPYSKVVSGTYAVDSTTTIPYSVELKTSLKITMQDGIFTYTLSLPDSNRLNPPAGSQYGQNSIANSDSDKLRFTDTVSVWADMAQNEKPDEADKSQAYVKSEEYLAEFNN